MSQASRFFDRLEPLAYADADNGDTLAGLATALMAQNAVKKTENLLAFHSVARRTAEERLTAMAVEKTQWSDTTKVFTSALTDWAGATTTATDAMIFDLGKVGTFMTTFAAEFGTLVEQTATGMVQAFMQGGRGTLRVLKGFVVKAIDMMIGTAVAALKIGAAISQALQFAWIPGLGAALIVGLLGALVAVRLAFTAGLAKMAEGGIVARPTLALIGEAGPEAVVPLRRGGRGGGLMPGGGLSLTVNIYGSVGVEDIGERIVQTLRVKGVIP